MADWDAAQYRRFEDDRTRPARELLARVPTADVAQACDLGCGPGNSTELIIERYPAAAVIGVNSSPAMLAEARKRLPGILFSEGNLNTWMPDREPDLLFANAVFQWVPQHPHVLARLAGVLAPGGTLAVQMPDNLDEPSHRAMRDAASEGPWAERMKGAAGVRGALPDPGSYYDLLRPMCRQIDIWHTIYNHVLNSSQAVVEWVKGTGLRPFLDAIEPGERPAFLEAYHRRIATAYPPRSDGKVLLRFPGSSSLPERLEPRIEPSPGPSFMRKAAMPAAKPLNPLLDLGLEFAPLGVFFVANSYFGIFVATGVFMVAITLALIASFALTRSLPIMALVSAVMVLVFGGLTLLLHDDFFIKVKPTIVNTMIGTILLCGLAFGKPLLPLVLDHVLTLTPEGWRKLTLRWAIFFFVLAALNEIVWRNFPPSDTNHVWVNFKVFGTIPLTLLFALSQTPLILRHGEDPPPDKA